jgi:TatD DNase family protein
MALILFHELLNMLIDIHTHQQRSFSSEVFRVYNLPDWQQGLSWDAIESKGDTVFSGGIHPWKASESLSLMRDNNLEAFLSNPLLILIGEIGLDRRVDVSFEDQMLVFNRQLSIANGLKKPVIIHMVGTLNEILQLKKNYSRIPAWIIHGFRGKKEMATQCLAAGFYLSFGEKFQPEVLNLTWIDKLFLESDENGHIERVYSMIEQVLNIPLKTLESQIEANFKKVFPNII